MNDLNVTLLLILLTFTGVILLLFGVHFA